MKPIAVLAALTLSAPAAAQAVGPDDPGNYARAVAAGYRAAMTCSGIFNAGRTPQQIEDDELAGIYPEYARIVPMQVASVDRVTRTVSVRFSETLPPRIAVWRSGHGCTTLPIGSAPWPVAARYPANASPVAPADPRPWPLGDAVGTIATPTPLSGVLDRAFAGQYKGRTRGVVIVQDGRIVAERYADGFGPFVSNRTWSVAKSIAGTLAGIAVRDRVIRTDTPAPVPAWSAPSDPRGRITLDQLLRMSSGLYSSTPGNRTDAIYFGGTAVTDEATGWPLEVAPGKRFRYANNDILLAMLALRTRLGDARYFNYPNAELFDRLGMKHTVAEADWRNNHILSSQVWSTARDLARLGMFWMADGVWNGKRILPVGWMKYMTTPSGPQPTNNAGYGATLWLFGAKQGLPDGSYAAQGNRGQVIMVIPSKKLVIVRRGEDMSGSAFDVPRFSADILAALP